MKTDCFSVFVLTDKLEKKNQSRSLAFYQYRLKNVIIKFKLAIVMRFCGAVQPFSLTTEGSTSVSLSFWGLDVRLD